MRLKVIICLLLAGITLAIYWPATRFMFIYHDDTYFIACPGVEAGLSPAGIDWVMKGVVVSNWHPITNLSFLMMHEFYGLNPGAEHLLNILFHAANTVLLFLVLQQMMGGKVQGPQSTVHSPESNGSVWRCAVVAAIFAWHPLRVESVAWIAERKDVLFAFFMLLSLWCYVVYAQRKEAKPPSKGGEPSISETGKMPVLRQQDLETGGTPILLRQQSSETGERPVPRRGEPGAKPFWEEMSPHAYYNWAFVFFILSFLCKATVVTLPFLLLLLDFWPLNRFGLLKSGQEPTPPHPDPLPRWGRGNGAARRPYLFSTLRSLLFEKARFFAAAAFFCVLTFWIHKNNLDVGSLVQFGLWERVENVILSYVNYPGKFFWPTDLAAIYPFPQRFDSAQVLLSALLLLAISALCILQIRRRPYLAVGWFWYLIAMLPVIGLVQIGVQAMADRHTYISFIGPSISVVWLVWDWARNRSWRKPLVCVATAAALAVCAVLTERQLQYWKDTVTLFDHTVAVTPENALAAGTVALGLEHEGHLRQAAVYYRIALSSRGYGKEQFIPNFYFAELLTKLGCYQEAANRLEAALKIRPDATDAMNNLAWILATSPEAKARNGARAVQWAERACDLTQDENPTYLTTLAAAYAEAGRFDDAVATTQKAITLANQDGLDSLAVANQELLDTYSAHQTYAQTHPAAPEASQ